MSAGPMGAGPEIGSVAPEDASWGPAVVRDAHRLHLTRAHQVDLDAREPVDRPTGATTR